MHKAHYYDPLRVSKQHLNHQKIHALNLHELAHTFPKCSDHRSSDNGSFPTQAPPPPPSLKRAALEVYVRKEVRPRVEAICLGGLEGIAHQTVCMAVANSLGQWQPIAGYGMLAPFCEKVCWHSCNGESHAGGQVR